MSQPPENSVTFAAASRSLLRTSLIEAARQLAGELAWRHVSMAAIAKRAGVSRQTLYNEFGSRQTLTQAMALHIVDGVIELVSSELHKSSLNPQVAFENTITAFLDFAHQDPLVSSVIAEEEREELLPLVTSDAKALLTYARYKVAIVFTEVWPSFSRAKAEVMADAFVRMALSFIVIPVDSITHTAESLAGLLGPFIRDEVAAVAELRVV